MPNQDDLIEDKGYSAIHLSKRKIMVNNFLGGLAWGFGTVLGASILAALVILILSRLGTVPLIGHFIARILSEVQPQQNIK